MRSDILTGISKVWDFKEKAENNNERCVSDTSHGMNGGRKPLSHVFSFKTAGISTAVIPPLVLYGLNAWKKNKFLNAQQRTDH